MTLSSVLECNKIKYCSDLERGKYEQDERNNVKYEIKTSSPLAIDTSNAVEAIVLFYVRPAIYTVLSYPPTNTAYYTVVQKQGKK